jgi:phosphonoacetaldehyde hydrolase
MMYANALRLNVYPMAAIVKVGDTLPDIAEGLNAGSWIVSVTESGNELGLSKEDVQALSDDERTSRLESIGKRFRDAGAHYVIRTIADLPPILDAIEARLQSGEQP